MRPPPIIRPEAIAARAHIEPGAAFLEIAVPHGIVGMRFDAGQVDQLERAIRGFRETVAEAGEFAHRRTVLIETSGA